MIQFFQIAMQILQSFVTAFSTYCGVIYPAMVSSVLFGSRNGEEMVANTFCLSILSS